MKPSFRLRAVVLAAFVLPSAGVRGAADARTELDALRAQVQQLQGQIDALARQIEVKEAAAAAAPAVAPKITATDRAFAIASPDALNALRLRGLVQFDVRQFFDDGGHDNNAFVLRRARIIAEGQFAKNFGFQIVPEFAGGTPSILDANVTFNLTDWATIKVGKFKVPVGQEQLQSDAWTFFNERSIVTNLVPNRDLGLQLSGDVLESRIHYTIGVFNGVGDGGSSNNTDFDEEKDVAGRIFVTPFHSQAGSPVQNLGVGLSGSLGRAKTTAGRASGYRSDGQQTFFSYTSSVIADGKNWRVSPHLDYRVGSLGLQAEYVLSVANLRATPGAPISEIKNRGWQVSAGYVLTGEDSSYNGVDPRSNFDPANATWGAFEIVGRVANLDIDEIVFPTFADPAVAASEATSLGLGLNWYLGRASMLKIDYYQTDFDFAAGALAVPAAPVLRQDEKALITRFQLTF